jgi:Ca-activated chloride channel family protein
MTFFTFQNPGFLLCLLAIPALLALDPSRRSATLRFSSVAPLSSTQSIGARWFHRVPLMLRILAIALLVIALARPQEGRKTSETLTPGVDIVLAIDTSGSMQALDFMRGEERINRLEVVKDVVRDFIRKRDTDRLGMVVFGGEAFTQAPLTLDHNILINFLDHLHIGMAGDSTAIGSALGISVKRLKDLKSKSKVIVLLTDGRNNAGNISPQQAAEIAATFDIKVYTVGVGTHGKAPFLVDTVFGQSYVYQEVDLDEDTLQAIAQNTGAKYFRATDRKTLEDIYNQIDQMEKSEVIKKEHSEYNELFPRFLYAGLFLLLLEIILSNTRLLKIP